MWKQLNIHMQTNLNFCSSNDIINTSNPLGQLLSIKKITVLVRMWRNWHPCCTGPEYKMVQLSWANRYGSSSKI